MILKKEMDLRAHMPTPRGNIHVYYHNSDYRKRWRDVISQHPGHSHGYKSVMAALSKAHIRMVYLHKRPQNAQIFKSFCCVMRKDCFQDGYFFNWEGKILLLLIAQYFRAYL